MPKPFFRGLAFAGLLAAIAVGVLVYRASSRSGGRAAERAVAASEPAKAIEPEPASTRLDQRCRARGKELQRRLGGLCQVAVSPPFVLAGDLDGEQLDRWRQRTIQPAACAMADSYFQTPPTEVITVLLFSGKSSYDRYAAQLYGDRDVSIYGYYKPAIRTLVMNIGTGGGTLVHELTHALIAFDFPEVPDWFNEGLASLHEQCRFRQDARGRWIEGLVNWRLPALQEAIREDRLPSLAAMVRNRRFRDDPGMNYAQSRYFCMFMQKKKVLQPFYRRFRSDFEHDPLGEKAVLKVFPGKSWKDLDAEFQQWALSLSGCAGSDPFYRFLVGSVPEPVP